MTSAVGVNHLPESLSGPCGCFSYHEVNTHKVTKPPGPAAAAAGEPPGPAVIKHTPGPNRQTPSLADRGVRVGRPFGAR